MAPPRIPAERRAAVLAEMSALLGSSLDYERALPRLVGVAVPVLGDLCAIDLIQDDGALHRVASAHVDSTKEALVYEIRARHRFNPEAAHGVPAVVRTRQPVLVSRVGEADLNAIALNAEHLALWRQLGPKSWIIVPLVAHDRALGAMTLAITESARRYGPTARSYGTVAATHPWAPSENCPLPRQAR